VRDNEFSGFLIESQKVASALPESKGTPPTILIADDDETIRNFVSALLRDNYTLLVAENGEDALRQSRAHKGQIHLLLSNVQMPGMTGVELGAKINLERPETKVMLMSGYASGMLVLNEGWHFLHKPFVPAQLRDLVKAILVSNNSVYPDLDEHPK
jgi:two-component system cell cycle sensor histidine kinase/response regulator CckA